MLKNLLLAASGLLLILLAGLLLMAFLPGAMPPLKSPVEPVKNFPLALEKIEELKKQAPPEVREECRGRVMHHGHPTKRVYVLMHGLTNCPAQFFQLGQMLFEQGANVVIPRLPYHGLSGDYDRKQIYITAENMLAIATLAVNLAHGLGEEVCVIGLSANGTIAAWLAQNRPDLHAVMVLAPFLAPPGIPDAAIAPLTRVLIRLPNMLLWWDPRVREALEGPEHAYRRFATHSLGWLMAIGLETFEQSIARPPAAGRVIMVNSAADFAISLPRAEALAANWEKLAPEKVTEVMFPADLRIPHDMIDPTQREARTDVVYPELIRLLEH